MSLKRARPSFDSDPILWWRTHKEEFQHLAKVVPSYLHAPATSVDCERLFSMAGIIYGNQRRGRLLGEKARLLLMIKTSSSEGSARTSKSWTYKETTQYGRIVDSESENYDEFRHGWVRTVNNSYTDPILTLASQMDERSDKGRSGYQKIADIIENLLQKAEVKCSLESGEHLAEPNILLDFMPDLLS
ncbi:dimerization domain protein, hAT family [Ancylostoma caninum]|uniref:Dimerization domain protein, hAT family n=1 Tax=Ancylostoma caninum TaxID=29170 RepID=A0A368G2H5_ANCCA|nr:dimerization domain protein, hAT family [Ancylostoma caninum]